MKPVGLAHVQPHIPIDMQDPLNINIYIPFKDKKGEALSLQRLKAIVSGLDHNIEQLIQDYRCELNDVLSIAPAVRPSGGIRKLYWRFKTGKQKRGYVRLVDDAIQSYLGTIDPYYGQQCIRYERSMLILNAQLKIVATAMQTLKTYQEHKIELYNADRQDHV